MIDIWHFEAPIWRSWITCCKVVGWVEYNKTVHVRQNQCFYSQVGFCRFSHTDLIPNDAWFIDRAYISQVVPPPLSGTYIYQRLGHNLQLTRDSLKSNMMQSGSLA